MTSRTRGIGTALASTLLMLTLVGCGTPAASNSTSSQTSSSASAKPAHHRHKNKKLLRIHGSVTSVSSTVLSINTKKGKTFTFALTSKTKYHMKKATSSLSAVKTGVKVVVVARRSKTGNPTAVMVRIL